MSFCRVALNISKLFMILFMHSGWIKSKDKLFVESIFSRINFILGWFWYISMTFLIVTVLSEVIVRPSAPRFWTIFPKYL